MENPLILSIEIDGPAVKYKMTKMSIEAIALARSKNCKRFFIDSRNLTFKDAQFESYEFISNLDKIGLKRTDRIAVVTSRNFDAYQFAEMVAKNRGWSLIKHFKDLPSAETWIRK